MRVFPQLSDRARERKVPATRISRLVNFGGKDTILFFFFFWHTIFGIAHCSRTVVQEKILVVPLHFDACRHTSLDSAWIAEHRQQESQAVQQLNQMFTDILCRVFKRWSYTPVFYQQWQQIKCKEQILMFGIRNIWMMVASHSLLVPNYGHLEGCCCSYTVIICQRKKLRQFMFVLLK